MGTGVGELGAVEHAAPRVRRRPVLLEACAPALVAVLVAWFSLQLRLSTLRFPFSYNGDGIFYLFETRMLTGAGSYLHTSHLGWPVGLQMYDYPQGGDTLHLSALWGLMQLARNPAVAVNLYYLAGFALVALVAHVVLRHLGIRPLVAAALAVVYAVLPYHFSRGELHLFLSGYFLVPVGVAIALDLVAARDRATAAGLVRSPWVVLGIIGLASTGAYYFAFTVLLVVAAAVGAAAAARQIRVLWSGIALAGFGVVIFLLNHIPSIWYWLLHGLNHSALPQRDARTTEQCGLRVAQLFLPQPNHHFASIGHYTRQTMTGWPPDETGQQVGVLAAAGLVLALGALVVGALAGRSVSPRSDAHGRLVGLGYLAGVCLLMGTIGGGSFLVAEGGLGAIRCWNRISVVVAFIGLAALGLLLERALVTRRSWAAHQRRTTAIIAVALLAVAAFDQTPRHPPDYEEIARTVTSDRTFFAGVAARLPAGAKVFQLPYVEFPDAPGPNGTGTYDAAKGFLYEPSLYWSYGVVRGRDDGGIPSLARTPPDQLPEALAHAGYQGVVLDRKALGDQDASLEPALAPMSGAALTSADGRYQFYLLADTAVAPPTRRPERQGRRGRPGRHAGGGVGDDRSDLGGRAGGGGGIVPRHRLTATGGQCRCSSATPRRAAVSPW